MANQLSKDLEIMFENYVESFENSCIVSRSAKKYRPDDTAMQRAGDVFHRPQRYHMDIVEGLDLTGKSKTDLVQRLVPSVFKEPKNILYKLDAREMRDPEHKTEAGRAAGQRLAAQIDSDLIANATLRATNVITVGTASVAAKTMGRDLWDAAAGIDATMTAIGVPQGINRCSFWNPFNYKDLAGELGSRAYAQGATLKAYEKAEIPPVASFESYKTDISGRVPKGTATALTLAAAPAHKVVATDSNDLPVDNRQGVITLSAAGLQVGDAFTIAGVHSVHQISKDTTDQLQVFRVLAVSGVTATISPQILPPDNVDTASRPYSNVDVNAANGAAITLLNKNAAATNLFWADGSVELMFGKLAFPTGQGPQVMTATTVQGATLIMSYFFDHIAGSTTTRFTTLYGSSVLVPEYVGLVFSGQ